MKAHIEFYFDFVCPLCFLATKPLREVIKEQKAEIERICFQRDNRKSAVT
ncbi:MAG: hypothetical protein PME_06680 [Priestia megaterium]|nr:DsbA family protein [Priestia aryabhattai]